MSSLTAWHGYISGRVQGVSFRYYTRQKAVELGLTGWVRNLSDGRVEVWVMGDTQAVSDLKNWLWQGSPMSKVTDVEGEETQPDETITEFTTKPTK